MTSESYKRILLAEKDNFWAFQMGRVVTLAAAASFLLLLQFNGFATVAVYPLYALIASDVILTFPYWRFAVQTVELENLERLRVYPVSSFRTFGWPKLRDTLRGFGPQGESRYEQGTQAIH